MRSLTIVLLFHLSVSVYSQQNLQTKFEKSGGSETVTYKEGIEYWTKLANQFEQVSLLKMGLTDSGEPLHLIIYNTDKVFDISNIHESNKPVILINNAIHAGEPDGVDASMMLIRNFAQNKSLYPYLKDIIIAIVPFYNIGGVLNRNNSSRVNQNGPEAYGFRGNARNYDLNRDFIKMDSKNAFSLVEIIKQLDPEVFVDTHVTNGSDHQHVLTLISTQHNKLGGQLGVYLEDTFEAEVFGSLREKDRSPVVYVNVHGRSPNEGWVQFWDAARYSSGYAALKQTIGFISESHMWKPYKKRVENTYDYLEVMVSLTAKNSALIQEKRLIDREQLLKADSLPIAWENNREQFRMVTLKGFETSNPVNDLTGNPLLYYNREEPIEKEVPFYNEYDVSAKVKVPDYYIIPKVWAKVIERLSANGVNMIALQKDSTIEVETYTISDYQTVSAAYEGHYLHYSTKTTVELKQITFRKGDLIVPTKQLAKRYLVEVLEPSSQDSFFNWNFFDTILQQKEGFSDYVFAEKAPAILKSLSIEQREEFKAMKHSDSEFAKSNFRQLDWIYKKSTHYEATHLSYPIYRYSSNE
ncbi:MAG: hypothetical protein ACJAT1_000457 [Marivirga sp.]|jgi:hypothetical protein